MTAARNRPSGARSPDHSIGTHKMRFTQGLIIGIVTGAILLGAMLLAVVIIWPTFRPPWVEAVGNSVLRTTAPQATVAEVEYAVADRHRNYIIGDDGKPNDPTYSDRA